MWTFLCHSNWWWNNDNKLQNDKTNLIVVHLFRCSSSPSVWKPWNTSNNAETKESSSKTKANGGETTQLATVVHLVNRAPHAFYIIYGAVVVIEKLLCSHLLQWMCTANVTGYADETAICGIEERRRQTYFTCFPFYGTKKFSFQHQSDQCKIIRKRVAEMAK